ncbi:MAG: hypothetical protein WCV59_01525 [Parcubacteria group bacterium]|jgi:hypothetical protein
MSKKGFFRIYDKFIVEEAKNLLKKIAAGEFSEFSFGSLEASIGLYLALSDPNYPIENVPPKHLKKMQRWFEDLQASKLTTIGTLSDWKELYYIKKDRDVIESTDRDVDYIYRLEEDPPYVFVRCDDRY